MNPDLVGKRYGPYVYDVGAEKIREYAFAIGGGVPSRIYDVDPPDGLPADYFDEAFAAARHGGLVAPPTFCVNFAIKPFLAATFDSALDLDFSQLVHGEQTFSFGVPVRPGDRITTTGVISALYEKRGNNFAVVETTSHNQANEHVVSATWTAVIREA